MAERITPEVVAELTAVAKAATPGPWTQDDTVVISTAPWPMEDGPGWADWITPDHEPLGRFVAESRTGETPNDAAHIAAFDPPTCLALLKALATRDEALAAERARVEVLEGALQKLIGVAHAAVWNADVDTMDDALRAARAALPQAQEPRDVR